MYRLNPVVSIIIPNYNHAQYVSNAINSVLTQTYSDCEAIVVDDGSTDNSREVIGSFGEKVRVIYQANQGLSAARNTGIIAAQGRYIGVLDADDMYEPEFVGTMVSLLESRSDADGAYCGYRFVDHLNNPLPQIEARVVPPEKLYQMLVDGNFLVPEAMFVRKDCYARVGLFDTSLSALEDLDMWLRITRQFKIVCTTKILTRHRVLPGSMSTDPLRQFQNRMNVIKKHFGAEPTHNSEWSAEKRQAYGRAYLTSAIEYLQAHNESRAFECINAMSSACPSLLSQIETFYELGCGDQPKGYRGDFSSLNLEKNFQIVVRMLGKLSISPRIKRIAYSNGYYAFGQLAYGQNDVKAARRFFFGAIKNYPRLILSRTMVGFVVRSLIGIKVVRYIKQLRGKLT